MADRYVRKTGSDSNNGNSPATAWLTLSKAHSTTGAVAGDVVWVGAGTYREAFAVGMTSPAAEIRFAADITGANTGDPGRVVWSGYTTNDKTTPPSTSALLNLNGRDNLTYEDFYMVGSGRGQSVVDADAAASTGITFRRCVMIAASKNGDLIRWAGSAGGAANWLLENCVLIGTPGTICVHIRPALHTADYDVAFTVRNCLFVGGSYALYLTTTGAGAGLPGGVVCLSATIHGMTNGAFNLASAFQTTTPCRCHNSWITNCAVGLSAPGSGQLVEDYNLVQCNSNRNNVTAGANSISDYAYAPLVDYGHSEVIGMLRRPFWMPTPLSPLLGFGNQASPAPPATDVLGRPRPAGGESALNGIGVMERHDTATKGAAADSDGGAGSHIILTGPADQDLQIPVDAASTTISVKCRWDSNHGDTNKPQALLLANAEIGVTAQTVTATGTAGSGYETLTFSAFTPTAAGWVTLRLRSRSAAGNGLARFDSVTVA